MLNVHKEKERLNGYQLITVTSHMPPNKKPTHHMQSTTELKAVLQTQVTIPNTELNAPALVATVKIPHGKPYYSRIILEQPVRVVSHK